MTDDEVFDAIVALRAEGRFHQPPATAEMVDAAEADLGFQIPPLLRRLYLEVANGGIDGILGVPGGPLPGVGNWSHIVETHHVFTLGTLELPPDHEFYYPTPGMVWLVDDGCCLMSLVDCTDPAGAMWGWDPGNDPPLFPLGLTLAEWLAGRLGLAPVEYRPGSPADSHAARQRSAESTDACFPGP